MFQEFFRVDVRSAESLLRLATCRLASGEKHVLLAYHAHAAAASPRGGLENQRISDAGSLFRKLLFPVNNSLAPRNGWQAGGLHFPPRAVFFTHHFDDFRPWPDERNLRRFTHLGKIGVFGQEPVARVN